MIFNLLGLTVWKRNNVNSNLCKLRDNLFLSKKKTNKITIRKVFKKHNQVCFNEDIEYDFGSHIWVGPISWLRKAKKHIPLTLDNCEDYWLSTTLAISINLKNKPLLFSDSKTPHKITIFPFYDLSFFLFAKKVSSSISFYFVKNKEHPDNILE